MKPACIADPILESLNLQGAHPIYVTHNTDLLAILQKLHQQNNHGLDTQTEIDRYLLLLCMEAQGSILLALRPWQNFVLEPDHVMSISMLPDLGGLVRETLNVNNTQPLSAFSRIMQYSMPFIKHNRMSFPASENIHLHQLADIVQIVLCSVLGCIPRLKCKTAQGNSGVVLTKKPLFVNRVRIFYTLWSLLQTFDKQNLYRFCNRYVQIVRLALMEYFIFYLHSNMPVEKSILCHVFNIELRIDDVCENLLDLVDCFRQSAFNSTDFTWAAADDIAHTLNERCNRLCKGKSKINTKIADVRAPSHVVRNAHMHDIKSTMRLALQLPQFQFDSTSLLNSTYIAQIHERITFFAMPYNLHVQQLCILGKTLQLQSVAGSRVFWLYHCLACDVADRDGIDRRMRLGSAGQVFCSKCHECEFVLAINTLGRFVKIGKKTYVFCTQCIKVHAWNQACAGMPSIGFNSDHVAISATQPKHSTHAKHAKHIKHAQQSNPTALTLPRSKHLPYQSYYASDMHEEKCVLCSRTLNLNRICLLHVPLAFLHHVYLCPRHTPLPNAMCMINTVPDLILAVRNKLEYVAHFDGRYR